LRGSEIMPKKGEKKRARRSRRRETDPEGYGLSQGEVRTLCKSQMRKPAKKLSNQRKHHAGQAEGEGKERSREVMLTSLELGKTKGLRHNAG